MDEHVVGMIRDNFRDLKETCHKIEKKIDDHIKNFNELEKRVNRYEGIAKAAGAIASFVGLEKLWHFIKGV